MNRILFTIAALSVVMAVKTNAQSYTKTSHGIKTTINSVGIEIQFYTPAIVRVLKWPENTSFTKESLSVVKVPQKTAVKLTQHGNMLSMKSESITVSLDLNTGKISFHSSSSLMLNEKDINNR